MVRQPQCLSQTALIRKFFSSSLEDSMDIGRKIGEQFAQGGVLQLEGEMGSGKTVLAKGIACSCGIIETVVSPSFQIIIEYNEGTPPLIHIDLYRLTEKAVAYLDLPGIIQSRPQAIVLIEWAVRAGDLLEEIPLTKIRIDITGEHQRCIWIHQ